MININFTAREEPRIYRLIFLIYGAFSIALLYFWSEDNYYCALSILFSSPSPLSLFLCHSVILSQISLHTFSVFFLLATPLILLFIPFRLTFFPLFLSSLLLALFNFLLPLVHLTLLFSYMYQYWDYIYLYVCRKASTLKPILRIALMRWIRTVSSRLSWLVTTQAQRSWNRLPRST